ncbi:uncharacterized protein LOC119299567 [Triticum dicoccoides]|uniref:uncharacterized protein LOC119299567 n=1 Tax=Triticum dicoccoides TaxID=85692 RepID=UPI00188E6D00|nr:uncharacterized protein LOC119299567 [Triticum dicoccoides]
MSGCGPHPGTAGDLLLLGVDQGEVLPREFLTGKRHGHIIEFRVGLHVEDIHFTAGSCSRRGHRRGHLVTGWLARSVTYKMCPLTQNNTPPNTRRHTTNSNYYQSSSRFFPCCSICNFLLSFVHLPRLINGNHDDHELLRRCRRPAAWLDRPLRCPVSACAGPTQPRRQGTNRWPECTTANKPKASTSIWDALAFAGPAPERINGRLAMVGFVTALAVEAGRGDGLLSQLSSGTGQAWFVYSVAVLSVASLVPLLARAEPAPS